MLFSNYSILVLVLLINMFTTARSLLSSTKLINNRIVTKKYLSSTTTLDSYTSSLETFLTDVAKIEIPKNSNTLLNILSLNENYELVNPSTSRKGLNPFLIPLAKNTKENNLLCYIRWPTQKDGMDLQLVKTTEAGINLVSLSTNQFIHRLAVEDDFYTTKNCDEVISLVNQNGVEYKKGDYMGMIKSGKFPAMSPEDMRLVLDRYLLTKVGQFPDCFERLAQSFLNKNDEVSALVTCERAVAVFYGWGHPIMFHTHMLEKLGRDKEARDSARAAMGMPSWTLATTKEELEKSITTAGFTSMKIVGDMHMFRSTDRREGDVKEGLSPIQVTLDQAAHLMDAVALGSFEGGWDGCRGELAKRYEEGGYPDMANFILTV